ncbi:uncharacterized protein LOC100575730 [Acyrthosiphon pisum]|uniref:Uncharacterized protein n=1 Tax=Acyrthosiphon pisum TaxID=7029 RepID=A0A8R2B5D3_ACYPI|nr:uncharacterized protein LOC100575730 [Acyrthosiphon pisum]|eukprot:XP_008182368.1 PREDICTED: uncharacterized protein LOC100575730 [Acyrthosiphon pisum]
MNMLKLLFVISTCCVCVRSDFSIEWICEETNAIGNCSTIPKITDWLQFLADNIDNDEYTDLYYCPFNIAERHAMCMVSFLKNCQQKMSEAKRHVAYSYMPRIDKAATHCPEGRPYKKEFREYTNCTRVMYNNEPKEWEVHSVNQQIEFGLLPRKMEFRQKCDVYRKYWEMQSSWILRDCGPKAEKFSRHVLSYMWPIMGLLNVCGDRLTPYGYFET